ncbi:MAG: hypothetical protein KDB03_01410 [Planctomycetales bacterium]|nr:hypothetical protein [Planctomycetales bacterium]
MAGLCRPLVILVCLFFASQRDTLANVRIYEEQYENRPHFVIRTSSATYWLDQASGGFSRLVDNQGADWIAFRSHPLNKFPDSAAAGYRGLPNMVFGSENPDAGVGHPGFDKCQSKIVADNSIEVTSFSGRWKWLWTFDDQSAMISILEVDPNRPYWFLYEGPVAGNWSPSTTYGGTDSEGPFGQLPDRNRQRFGRWQWVYFGQQNSPYVLVLKQLQLDDQDDTFWLMGNGHKQLEATDGMLVFGFGRGPGTQPLLRSAPSQFRLGFVRVSESADEHARHSQIAQIADTWLPMKLDRESNDGSQQGHTGGWRGPQPPYGRIWPTDSPAVFQRYWFQLGDEFANPPVNNRFRVNDPYVATHPTYHDRQETRGNGLMLIPFEEDLRQIDAARLYVEFWGGHPHSTNRRITINGRTTYTLPVPTDEQCSHGYKQLQLKITDLVRGLNALQFAVDGDQTFWGHFIVEEAALDALLPASDARVRELNEICPGLPVLTIESSPTDETMHLSLQLTEKMQARIAQVHFLARYEGFDENGDGDEFDWHGMTKRKQPLGHIGTVYEAPYEIIWDVSMLPAQDNAQVCALVELTNEGESLARELSRQQAGDRYWKSRSLFVQTAPANVPTVRHPPGVFVQRLSAQDLSIPFWSRAGRVRGCTFLLPVPMESLERAMLQTCIWDGGRGEVENYFQLNGQPLEVASNGSHSVIYTSHSIPVDWLRDGRNKIQLLSDTEHHGIEVLYPGPELTIRYQSNDSR